MSGANYLGVAEWAKEEALAKGNGRQSTVVSVSGRNGAGRGQEAGGRPGHAPAAPSGSRHRSICESAWPCTAQRPRESSRIPSFQRVGWRDPPLAEDLSCRRLVEARYI
jgi:hypothetical protein